MDTSVPEVSDVEACETLREGATCEIVPCAEALQSMAVFAAIVDARSFSVAAQTLGITASAASGCISRLEARLCVKLLKRRPLELTPAGELFHRHCRRILRDVAEAHAAIETPAHAPA
jgi:DNA-binding transcriptional LysR family regulator